MEEAIQIEGIDRTVEITDVGAFLRGRSRGEPMDHDSVGALYHPVGTMPRLFRIGWLGSVGLIVNGQ